MSNPAISLKGVSKHYKVFNHPRDMFLEPLLGGKRHRDFVALEDVSVQIEEGSVVGLIGRNGAGKSTLLKILAGTLDATSGTVKVNGRISAILELGSGFNADYTGRENIYLGGLCLGLTRKEIQARETEIIEFSELNDFIDQPFRIYSSGMQARLTFSVAVCINPDILIVDEALSVGDARFQRKCFRRFEEFKAAGCTILFVTHQTGIVESICDRAIYLAGGRVVGDGIPRDVVGQYMQDLFGADAAPVAETNGASTNQNSGGRRYGTGEASIFDFGVLDASGRAMHISGQTTYIVVSGDEYIIYCDVKCHVDLMDDLYVGISITTKDGVRLLASDPIVHRVTMPKMSNGNIIRASVAVELNLGLGDYFVTFGAWGIYVDKHYDRRVDALHLIVRGDPELSQSLINMRPRYSVQVLG